MADYDEGLKHSTYIAGADFRTTDAGVSSVGLALKLDADGEVTLNGQHGVPVGFLDLAPEDGTGTPITVLVEAYRHDAVASEAIAVGDLCNTEANGRLGKAANPSGGGTQFIYGRAVSAAAAAGDHFLVAPVASGGWA